MPPYDNAEYRSSKSRDAGEGLTTQRLESFSDGVFSIAITLLVLELAIPDSRSPNPPPLQPALLSLWPSYVGYILTFLIVGIYWANHHYIYRLYKQTNHAFNILNILFLMSISFLPFPTAVLSRYVGIPAQATIAVMFYAFGLLLPAVSFRIMWVYASTGYRLIDPRLAPDFITHLTKQYALSVVMYLGALGITPYSYKIGLGICICLTLLYLFPSKTPRYREDMGSEQGTSGTPA